MNTKNLLTLLFIILSLPAFSQFRMVGNVSGSWTTLNDSTYEGTVNFQSDLTGMGYLATQIADTFKLFTGTEQLYRIDSVGSKTFSSAFLRIIRQNGAGSPSGQVVVFNPAGKPTIPDAPFGSTGATAQMNAAIVTWNARQTSNLEAGSNISITGDGTTGSPYVINSTGGAVAYDSLVSGSVLVLVARIGGTVTTISSPAAGEFDLTSAGGADIQRISVYGNNTTLNGSNEMILRLNYNSVAKRRRVSVQLYDANSNSLVDQQATATVNTQVTSGAITTITIPGLNGFAGTGFFIELR